MNNIKIIANPDVAKVTFHSVPDKPGIAAEIFGFLGELGFNVELVVSTPTEKGKSNISFVIARKEILSLLGVLSNLKNKVRTEEITHDDKIALISITGHGFSAQPGIAGRVFKSLSKAGINLETVSTSLHAITCVIREEVLPEAQKALDEEFKAE
ncbi:MAG: ACT domain-containing protein [candidate division Zixibacteria bacterium]|nr:ACT domain-containing protein [candidate division Zixibacteria bacterium]